MRQFLNMRSAISGLLCGCALVLGLAAGAYAADPIPLEIHEFSLWIVDTTISQTNSKDHYPNTLPVFVESTRSRLAGRAENRPSPLGVMTFYGEPAKDVEVEMQLAAGSRFLAHWTPAETKSKRARWIDVTFSKEPEEDARIAPADAGHWMRQARELDGALYLRHGARGERFLCYDIESGWAPTLKLTGGPEKYDVENLGKIPLEDVFVIAPTEGGRRIGRLKLLPAKPEEAPKKEGEKEDDAKKEKEANAEKKADEKANPYAPQAEEKPQADSKPKTEEAKSDAKPEAKQEEKAEKKDEAKPDANAAPAKPKEDDKSDKKADEKKSDDKKTDEKKKDEKPAAKTEEKPAAKDEDDDDDEQPNGLNVANGAVFTFTVEPQTVPVAAKPAEAKPAEKPAAEQKPQTVELVMSELLAVDSTAYIEQTRTALRAAVIDAGLKPAEADLLVAMYADQIFSSKELLVLYRLPNSAIEEQFPLVTYPDAKKIVRVPLVLLRNADPNLQGGLKDLVVQLAAVDYKAREKAEKKLKESGRLAVPLLREALKNTDPEVVFRAERLLLAQNEGINESSAILPEPKKEEKKDGEKKEGDKSAESKDEKKDAKAEAVKEPAKADAQKEKTDAKAAEKKDDTKKDDAEDGKATNDKKTEAKDNAKKDEGEKKDDKKDAKAEEKKTEEKKAEEKPAQEEKPSALTKDEDSSDDDDDSGDEDSDEESDGNDPFLPNASND